VVFDLEDAVAPAEKHEARQHLAEELSADGFGYRETVIRINGIDSPDWHSDLAVKALRIWAMVETTAGLVSLDEVVAHGLTLAPRLDCLVVGTNDIAKETGVDSGDERRYLLPWLMNVVLVAKRRGVCVLDGVWNDFSDQAGFEAEARQSVKMAFDGKTLIHPSQIAPANRVFTPPEQAIEQAREIVAAFDLPPAWR
jgi:citrate lyase subunit beta / citryl-CoA lyase